MKLNNVIQEHEEYVHFLDYGSYYTFKWREVWDVRIFFCLLFTVVLNRRLWRCGRIVTKSFSPRTLGVWNSIRFRMMWSGFLCLIFFFPYTKTWLTFNKHLFMSVSCAVLKIQRSMQHFSFYDDKTINCVIIYINLIFLM